MTDERQRSVGARLGLVALNALAPGLGVLRVAGVRAALPLLAGSTVLTLVMSLIGLIAPRPDFTAFAVLWIGTLAIVLGIYVAAIVRTWRSSRYRRPTTFWSRWHGLVIILLLVGVGAVLATTAFRTLYKPFYLPAESMLPTLAVNDRILADMRGGRHPKRGDLILFDMPEQHTVYIKRVAALPGDRIAMVGGVPIINGQRPRLQPLSIKRYDGQDAKTWRETLPGEAGSHEVLDLEQSAQDDMPERVIPAGHLFVLGDNRDRSADSRFPRNQFGVDLLPIGDIVGRPLFIFWSDDRSRIGMPLDR